MGEIRDRVGMRMDICVDCWGRFDFLSGCTAKALEPFGIMYLEDAMLMNNAHRCGLARETSVPICMSETMATRYEYREFFELEACDVVMYDLWRAADRRPSAFPTWQTPIFCLCRRTHVAACCSTCARRICAALPTSSWKATTGSNDQFFTCGPCTLPNDGYVSAPDTPGIGADQTRIVPMATPL
jgi:L-alanine-DL-glutamate epimerase-like enolase superfamily enzyme